MPVRTVSGDPLLTTAQFLAVGHNARGRTELGRFETAVLQCYPAPFSTYQKQCRHDRITAGSYWLWRESRPYLAFMVVRESSVGATRLRFVQSALLTLARDYARDGIASIAIPPLGNAYEWPEIRRLIDQWLEKVSLPVIVYDQYLPGVQADEGF